MLLTYFIISSQLNIGSLKVKGNKKRLILQKNLKNFKNSKYFKERISYKYL